MTPAQRDDLMELVRRFGDCALVTGKAVVKGGHPEFTAALATENAALDDVREALSALTDWSGASIDVEDTSAAHPLAPFCLRCGIQHSRFDPRCDPTPRGARDSAEVAR